MVTVDEWEARYRDALPDQLRPRRGDERVTLAAVDAHAIGWQPEHLAALVARQSYTGAHNPVLLAIRQLEQLAPTQPGPRRKARTRRPDGCLVCPPDKHCPDPVRDRTPPEWVAERFHLIRELMTIPDMTEDERGTAMDTLIRIQRNRHMTGLPA